MKYYSSPRKIGSKKGRSGWEALITRQLGWTLTLLWTLVVGISFTWSYLYERDAARHAAAVAARAQFDKDVIYRRWNAEHGGVYVPISESSPSNPYLTQVKERDIETTSGRRLTLINPAYMTRQVHMLGLEIEGVSGHITSLDPIRPANAPDDWEIQALKAFEGDEPEFSSIETLNGEDHLRLMRPLMTEKGCLKCHAQQGYKEGDIRGGISVTIPMAPYMAISQEKLTALGFGYCALWLLGLAGVGLGMRRIGRHITERDRAEEALKKESDRSQRYLDVAGVIFVALDTEQNLAMINKKGCEILGYEEHEIIGKNWFDHFVKAENIEEVKSVFNQIISGNIEPADYYENQVLRKDGNERIIVWHNSIIRDESGVIIGTLSSGDDITEKKQAEEAFRESEEKLARSKKMESLGLLAGGVAHDLNNVLSGIVSYPELLLMDLPEDSKLRKPIETMQDSGRRAAAIVQDLLTVARGVATTKEPLDLNDLIGDYLKSPELNKLGHFHPTVTVRTNLDADLFNINGSNVHIRKAIMNLVSNALEAIEGGGNITISTMNRYVDRPLRGYNEVTIGEYAILSVSDDGSGISSDDLERIFEPFYTKKVMGRSGTGLGLAVVWNVVQDHKGYIDVITGKNGTTFELYFPITRDEISDKDLAIPIQNFKGDGETILVVDDVENQREISCKMLDTLGYNTEAVSSGEEAVEYLKEHTVDLILLDMIMDPGISGRETYERIIEIHPNQKAIIISGFAETYEVKEAQKAGAGKYLKKPVTLQRIGLAVKEELDK